MREKKAMVKLITFLNLSRIAKSLQILEEIKVIVNYTGLFVQV